MSVIESRKNYRTHFTEILHKAGYHLTKSKKAYFHLHLFTVLRFKNNVFLYSNITKALDFVFY